MKAQKKQTDQIEKLLLNADIKMSDQVHLANLRLESGEVSEEQERYADKIAQKIADVLGDIRHYKNIYEK